MARFNYVALDARGQEASGLLEATSSNAAISQLRQAGYFPTSVIEEAIISPDGKEARRRTPTAARMTKPRAKKSIVHFQRRKVKSKILMIFTRQLATLIDSGLPLLRSLTVLAKQERDKVLKNTIDKLADSVQSGSTFSDALALHPKIFNDLYVNMIKAGEVGGVLELVLTRLSEFQEKASKIKNKVLVAIVVIYNFIGRTRKGRLVIDIFKLRMPLFGNLNRKTAISRFARTLGTLVTSGVPILQALNITRETAGNAAIARAIARVHDSV